MAPRFVLADLATQRQILIDLNVEYMRWVMAGIESSLDLSSHDTLGMPLPDYVASAIDKVCADQPPKGAFYLLELNGQWLGMGGLRRLNAAAAEIKRVYVRPAWRGQGLGEFILQRMLTDAQAFGYQQLCLDSAPFMHAAHRLYESMGFTDCAAYEGTEVPPALHPKWRFMSRRLC